jgi:hypothetical protein
MFMLRWVIIPVSMVAASITPGGHRSAPIDSGSFVTTLGRDTVVLESFTRTEARVDGDIVVRVPGTVLLHYAVDLAPDGAPTHSVVDVKPLGTSAVAAHTATIDFANDSMAVDIDSAGQHTKARVALGKNAVAQLMTGFRSSYGLYVSPALYETYAQLAHANPGDTVRVIAADIASGRAVRRLFVKPSPTELDADFFGIAFTRYTLDAAGLIVAANAAGTTEQTMTTRTAFIDVPAAAQRYAAADQDGHGIGSASPSVTAKATIGGQLVVVAYSSPRRRNRSILGNVVPFGQVWRTGANAATLLFIDRSFDIGGKTIPAGVYSLWTVPKQDGSVTLIINSQHGQWGTNYDSRQNIAQIPMQVSSASPPQEDFQIAVSGGETGALRVSWDNFVWSVPVSVAK